MKNLPKAAKLVLADLTKLETPAVATSVAAIVVPIIVALLGVHITAAEVGGWLILAGGAAATVQNLSSGRAKPTPAPAPAPAAPPAKGAKHAPKGHKVG